MRQGVNSLRADLGAVVAQRLEAKSISTGLGTELADVWGILQAEGDEHDLLRAAVGVVFDDLGVARPEETGSLTARAVDTQRGCASLRRTLFTPGSPKPLPLPILIMIRRLTWR